jgi:hypothetical protein
MSLDTGSTTPETEATHQRASRRHWSPLSLPPNAFTGDKSGGGTQEEQRVRVRLGPCLGAVVGMGMPDLRPYRAGPHL